MENYKKKLRNNLLLYVFVDFWEIFLFCEKYFDFDVVERWSIKMRYGIKYIIILIFGMIIKYGFCLLLLSYIDVF